MKRTTDAALPTTMVYVPPDVLAQHWCPWCGDDTEGGFCDNGGACEIEYAHDIASDTNTGEVH